MNSFWIAESSDPIECGFFFLTEILKLLHSVSYQLYLNKTEEKQTKIKRGFLQLRVVDYFG